MFSCFSLCYPIGCCVFLFVFSFFPQGTLSVMQVVPNVFQRCNLVVPLYEVLAEHKPISNGTAQSELQ